MKFPDHVSESTKRRNPDLYGVAGLSDPVRQQPKPRPGEDRELGSGTKCLGYRITIISARARLVDGHDNFRAGAKPLTDAITASLGFASDEDPRLKWEFAQIQDCAPGTIIKISTMLCDRTPRRLKP